MLTNGALSAAEAHMFGLVARLVEDGDLLDAATELARSVAAGPVHAMVRTRSLVLQCAEDAIAPRVVGEYVHRHLAGSRLVVMEATGHCPNLSAPAETIAAIRAFL